MPWITRNRSFTCVLYFCSLSVYADNTEQAKDTGHSLVEAEHLEDKPSEVIHFQEKSDNQNIDSNAALMHVPGLTVVDSGPLSRSELHYHGLSNARYRIDLEGLDLNNPMNGMSDANSLFLFAAQQLIAGPQSLSLRLPNPREPVAKALFGYGSLHSFKIGASAGLPLGEYSSAFAAAQMSGSQGDFSFSSPDLPKGPENSFQRRNNDQQRIQALAKIQRQSDSGGAHLLLAVNGHEGGLPGFAFDPKESQRTETWFSGFNAGFNKKHKDVQFFVASSHSLFSYDAQNQAEIIDNFRASVHELSFSLKPLTLPQGMDFELGQKIIIERAYELDKTRIGGGLFMKRNMLFRGKLKPRIIGDFSMLGFHKHGLIFKKSLAVSIEPHEYITVVGQFMRSQRLPTFLELYADNRFFIGNEDLEKESIWDFELASILRMANINARIAAIFGYLSNNIIYEPFLATKLRPKNIETAYRYGLDLGLSYSPLKWLLLESKNAFIKTRIKKTKSALPYAPLFSGFSRIRFGTEDFLAFAIKSRYRSSSTANEYGTLKSPGYILVDSQASYHFLDLCTLSFSVSNIFNIKTARDSYEMPLPGTLFFGQIELGNM